MKVFFFNLLVLSSFLLVGGCDRGGQKSLSDLTSSGNERLDFESVSSGVEGIDDSKPTLKIFTASWCPPCKMMKKDVYPSEPVVALASKLNWVFYDVDTLSFDQQQEAKEYAVSSIPMYVLVSSSGEVVDTMTGGADPAGFASFLKQAL